MVSNMEDIKTFKWISEALHEPATLQKIFFYLLFPLCLSVLSALNKGADILLFSPHPCSPLSAPPHTFCPTTAPPPTTTPPPPPKKHWCPPCLLISVYACVFTVCIVSCCGPCLSPCLKWHHWTKRGSVSGGGGLSWCCCGNSIIHPMGGRDGGLSLRKAFKREEKKELRL